MSRDSTLEKEFLNWEQSKALRELGFAEECFGWYFGDIETNPLHIEWIRKNVHDPYIAAPIFQQALRFFRDTYSIIHTIDLYWDDVNKKRQFFYVLDATDLEIPEPNDSLKDTYREAEEACIDKLILIAKLQQDATDRKQSN